MFTILGLNVYKVHKDKYIDKKDYDYNCNDEIINEYELFFKDNDTDKLYKQKFVKKILDCNFGYAENSWLIEGEKQEIKRIGTLHYIPKEILEVDSIYTNYEGNGYYRLHGELDVYYPDGDIEIYFENWHKTSRAKDKRYIYIFRGPSSIGKSYLSHLTEPDLSIYETDSDKNLEGLNISYDIIVIGNKYGHTLEDIKNRLEKSCNCKNLDNVVELILVDFNYINYTDE